MIPIINTDQFVYEKEQPRISRRLDQTQDLKTESVANWPPRKEQMQEAKENRKNILFSVWDTMDITS